MQDVGARIRDLREEAKKTQAEVAKVLGTTQQLYSNYELGKCDIPVRYLLGLADYYGTSTDYLLGRVSYPNVPPQFSESFIQTVTIGDFVCKITSFNSKSKSKLIEYVNYLTYMESTKKKTRNSSKNNEKDSPAYK